MSTTQFCASLMCAPTTKEVDKVVDVLSTLFDVEDQGNISDYLGVKVGQDDDGSFHFTQTHLIDQILSDLHLLQPGTKTAVTPSLLTKVVQPPAENDEPFDESFHYRSVIGKLNFLEK